MLELEGLPISLLRTIAAIGGDLAIASGPGHGANVARAGPEEPERYRQAGIRLYWRLQTAPGSPDARFVTSDVEQVLADPSSKVIRVGI